MKFILFTIFLFVVNIITGQDIVFNGWRFTNVTSDTAKFTFGITNRSVPGWVAVLGNPKTTVRTGTQFGITISTIATANWNPEGVDNAADNAAPSAALTGWPAAVGTDYFFNKKVYATRPGSASEEHFLVFGLVPFATYKFEWLGSRTTGDPSRKMYYTIRDNTGVTVSAEHDAKNNTNIIVTLTGVADASGYIYLSGYGSLATANAQYSYYNALKIYKQ